MEGSGSSTLAEQAYRRIRADILSGRLEPSRRLRVEELSALYELGSGVLREALPRLAGQGLVDLVPQQGYRVISVSREDLEHLCAAQVVIETQVLRQSIESGTLEWEADLVAVHHTLRRVPMMIPVASGSEVNDRWLEVHDAFHRALLAGCPNGRLRALAASIREQAEIYRVWSAAPGQKLDRDVGSEHDELCELAVGRDVEGAVVALTQHIEMTRGIVLEAKFGLSALND